MPLPIKHKTLYPQSFNPAANHSKLKYIFYKIKRKEENISLLFYSNESFSFTIGQIA